MPAHPRYPKLESGKPAALALMLTKHEAADALGVGVDTLDRYRRGTNPLPSFKRAGRIWFNPEHIALWARGEFDKLPKPEWQL